MSDKNKNSVHLQNYPEMSNFVADEQLIETMNKIRLICSCALFIRDKYNLRVRLPLNKVTIFSKQYDDIKEFTNIIADEINVKQVEFSDNIDEYGKKSLALNFQKIGKKVGSKMPNVIKAANNGKWKIKDNILCIEDFELNEDEYCIKLETKEDDVLAIDGYDILVKLDLNLTDDLEKEGMARDLVRIIQQFRKDTRLDVSDNISLVIKTNYEFLKDSVNSFLNYIKEQTLATDLVITKNELNVDFSFCEEINGNVVQIGFSVVNKVMK